MPFELWGATETPRLLLPERPIVGYVLLALYLLAFLTLLYRYRADFTGLTWRQRGGVLLLVLASVTVSQLFPISIASENQLPPLGAAQNPQVTLTLFGAVPFLLAGAILNPGAALVVGLFSGLGRALWQTHQVYDPFYFAIAAWLAALCLQQRFEGRVYQWLRIPAVSGGLSLVFLLSLVGVGAFAYADAAAGNLAALDWAISSTTGRVLSLLVEGVFSGLVVMLIFRGMPQWRPRPGGLLPSPQDRSVSTRLLTNFAIFAVLLSAVLIIVVFNLAVDVSTRLVVNQMGHDAAAVSRRIPDFRSQMQNLLHQYRQEPALQNDDPAVVTATLTQIGRSAGATYRRLILVDEAGEVVATYPEQGADAVVLTEVEKEAVADALARGAPSVTSVQGGDGTEHVLSVVAPVGGTLSGAAGGTDPAGALIGRIPNIAMNDLIVGLQGTVGEGNGFIVDEHGRVVAHPNERVLLTHWALPDIEGRKLRVQTDSDGEAVAYEGRESETNARELVYYLRGVDHPWQVVITVPYQVVLRLALQISAPLVAVLIVAMVLFGLNLVYMSRTVTNPLRKLVQASQQLANGEWNVSVPAAQSDEVGQLGHAFDRMRRSMQQQFEEITLLLGVSQNVSTSLDVQQGIPTILRGALRGTGASGSRAIVLNPSGRHPLTFGEGPAKAEMAGLDRKIALLARQHNEIILSTPEEIRDELQLDAQPPPVGALIALPLYAKKRFQGVIWVGFRQAHAFTPSELNMLRTLSGQASVLVENAHLFATAEGGRRRLAAVLASTSDAVIVTDQTERVLLINPALERTFHVRANDVVGRAVADVLPSPRLVAALTGDSVRAGNLEIPTDDGRTLYASASTISSNSGQVLGRVAVLHDITYLKEIDEMKSEFVSTVSHDLRGPLTFMRGYVTMLPMVGDTNDKQANYIDKILGGVDQMQTLVEDLLDLGRIEADMELARDVIDAHKLLQRVIDEQAEQARASGTRLTAQVEPDVPLIMGDASLISRAMANLVSNAIKYAPDSDMVALRAERDVDEVVFSVQDHGPGIPKGEQIRLFEKFYRAKQRGTTNVKGTGLGLAIVKSIAERHGGRVWCHSTVGEGSTFYVAVPVNGQRRGT